MDDRRQERIAANEVRYREMNERIVERVEALGADTPTVAVLCECAIAACDGMIDLASDEYTRVRSNPRWFAVLADHVVPEAEVVVERRPAWWIVEKTGAAGAYAEAAGA